ncbi:indole-3-glycerol phosphate synthase [Candidatus Epulonipiscioides gigas]|nr:indole-3-glycerol phosphate synthase [Epulopiscium sp. SCG-C07WGA-EpuloA2]
MILDKIIEATQARIINDKELISMKELRAAVETAPYRPSFELAISRDKINFICEVKKASPSKGVIAEDFDYKQIALDYEIAGASAISVLTEPDFFLGSSQYLEEISEVVRLPILKKDFIIDPYQIYQAKANGASAILLICNILETEQLREYFNIATSIGLDSLVEAHDAEEIEKALNIGANIIGVNNRNLETFEVDINTSVELRKLVPNDKIFVAESGIQTREDIEFLENAKVNAVLIGETLMKEANKFDILRNLQGI